MTTFLTVEDCKAMTVHPSVSSKADAHLGLDISRAHRLIRALGRLPSPDAFMGDVRSEYLSDMRLAHFLVTERVALSHPTTGMAAAGVTFERSGRKEVSRASTTDRSGATIPTELITPEVEEIVAYWALDDDEEFAVTRERVFPSASGVNSDDDNERVVLESDLYLLTPDPDTTSGYGG